MRTGCCLSAVLNYHEEETQAVTFLSRVSLFPYSSLILPGGQLRIKIVEQQYLSMMSACLKKDHGFGVYLVESDVQSAVEEKIYHGTMVRIVDWDREDDGLLTVLIEGCQRLRVVETSANSLGALVGDVEILPKNPHAEIPLRYRNLSRLLQRVLDRVEPLVAYKETELVDAAWVSNRLTELLPMSFIERYELVAISDPIKRLSLLQCIVEQYINTGISLDTGVDHVGFC